MAKVEDNDRRMVAIPEKLAPTLDRLVEVQDGPTSYGIEIQRALLMYAKSKGVKTLDAPIILPIGRRSGPESPETRARRLAKKAEKISGNPV